MHEKKWADQALKSFDDVVGAIPGFRNREGQRKMAAQIAQTFSQAQLGKIDEGAPEPTRSIAVVQAGTGVGKSLAYSIRSEEHTSELQSQSNLVCRLLLEKKKK